MKDNRDLAPKDAVKRDSQKVILEFIVTAFVAAILIFLFLKILFF